MNFSLVYMFGLCRSFRMLQWAMGLLALGKYFQGTSPFELLLILIRIFPVVPHLS